ncbi:SNW/SKI-interacting protein A-like protein, partial [Tanacetum coccineum]
FSKIGHGGEKRFDKIWNLKKNYQIVRAFAISPLGLWRVLDGLGPSPVCGLAQDFCDGGSFPELHHARYSVDMGRKKDSSSGIRTLRVKHNEKAKKIAYSQQNNLVRMILKDDKEDDDKHTDIEETTQPTKSAIKKIANVILSAEQPKGVQTQSQEESKFIKYTPLKQLDAFNSGAKERIARMVENPKGYTVPLDKQVAVDGRGLDEDQLKNNIAELSESLYIREQKARESVFLRLNFRRN